MLEDKKSYSNIFLNGIFNDNPIFRLALSMCPAVGISTNMMNGLLMGIAVLFVQICSSLTISLMKNFIHPRIRIPTYTLTIATWVTVTDLVLAAFFPVAYKSLGIFVRLIVVFCFITMRLDVFARKNPVFPSLVDAVGMGFGFMFGMIAIGGVRELMGMGTLLGYDILGFRPLLFFVLPASGFFVVGFMMAIFNYTETIYNQRKRARSTAS
ncbi:MAG: electron transport complex subunit RsxE [Candidatus Magnetomorum sp.]|nr:electron transport complex subunit RsxE [Candidatus Magnetomorum sp.]